MGEVDQIWVWVVLDASRPEAESEFSHGLLWCLCVGFMGENYMGVGSQGWEIE